MFAPISPFLSPKSIIRERMKAERRAAAKARPDAARHAARNFIAAIEIAEGAVVALYHPMADELDPLPLAAALAEKGATLALPVVAKKNAPLAFREWRPGDALEAGPHRTSAPAGSASDITPTIIVTPLVAFTRAGARLGQGGGYYDRTLEALRARGPVLAVGFAYGAQQVDGLPADALDQPLDWIVTEREAIRAAKGS